jgi:hypothetical protein
MFLQAVCLLARQPTYLRAHQPIRPADGPLALLVDHLLIPLEAHLSILLASHKDSVRKLLKVKRKNGLVDTVL